MKRIPVLLALLFTLSVVSFSCREKKDTGDKIEEAVEEVGDELEDGAEEIEEEIEDAIDN